MIDAINKGSESAPQLIDNLSTKLSNLASISSTSGNFFSALSNTSITFSTTLKASSMILPIGACIFESKLFNIDDVIVFTSLTTMIYLL